MTTGDLIAYLSRWDDDTEVAFIIASPVRKALTGDKFFITDVGRPAVAISIVKEIPFHETEVDSMDGTIRSDTIM